MTLTRESFTLVDSDGNRYPVAGPKELLQSYEFLDFDRLDSYKGFGGVRIEDDVLVTADGHRVLGRPIPKTPDEVESEMGGH